MEAGASSGEACGGDRNGDSGEGCRRGRGLSTVIGVRIGRILCGGGGGVTGLAGMTEMVVNWVSLNGSWLAGVPSCE